METLDKGILVVDKDVFMRVMIRDILSRNGYTVSGEAENGVKAIETYEALKPRLVIMELILPGMDGIQAIKRIRALDSSALIIACSAMGQQAIMIEAIQAGAKDFIVKPFNSDRVIQAVRHIIG